MYHSSGPERSINMARDSRAFCFLDAYFLLSFIETAAGSAAETSVHILHTSNGLKRNSRQLVQKTHRFE